MCFSKRNRSVEWLGLQNPSVASRMLVCQCYTDLVLKSITIRVSEEAARWARRKADEDNTSVSKLVGRMLENQMRIGNQYWHAYDRWKKIGSIKGINAAGCLSREQVHERR